MKRIYLFIIAALMLASCSESFLDTEPLTKKVDANYYATPTDYQLALTGTYSSLNTVNNSAMSSLSLTSVSPFLTSEVMSDDRFGGGGVNDADMIACEYFKISGDDQYIATWTRIYEGIFRANMLIKKIDEDKASNTVAWENNKQRGEIEGQARYLRAYFYLDLARMFGQVPLIVETTPLNLPKASPDEIFAQIATDLKTAIEAFPSTKATDMPLADFGRATKWAAEGLMARAFLFYTGYYQKTEMPLVGGGSISKQQVSTWIDDCVANSGHKLMPEFRNLWPYSYVQTYNYVKENGLKWYGEEGANLESVWAISFSNLASWKTTIYYSNQLCLYQGIRKENMLTPFGQGWGVGPVNPQLYESWPDEDLRKKGSIWNVNDPTEDVYGIDLVTGNHIAYAWGGDKQMHETGYWQKKYLPINQINPTNPKKVQLYSVALYGAADDFQLGHTQDLVMIRFSDILLMGAELELGGGNAQAYLDQVRNRVKLPSVPATLENIKNERRWELAFEGGRYYDLLRWHDAETAFAKVKDIPVKDQGENSLHTTTFRPETGGFLPIPNSQILLSDGPLVQNPGWDGTNARY